MKQLSYALVCSMTLAMGAVRADGIAINFSDIQGMPDNNASESFEKSLKALDPLQNVMTVKMSDRKPEFITQNEKTATIRYFFTLAYDKNKYDTDYVPKLGKMLKEVAKGVPKEISLRLAREELPVRMVELTQEPTLFKPGILDYTYGNPESSASVFYVPNQMEFDKLFPYVPRPRQLNFGYIDVVEKVGKSGTLAVRRYDVSGDTEAIFARWCSAFREGLKGRKVVLSLMNADGETIEEKAVNIRYPGIFNYPHDQPYVGFSVLAPRRDISQLQRNPETGLAYYYIAFSPMFVVPVRNSLQAGGLVESLECFADVSQKKADLRSVVKAEIKFAD